MASFKDNNGKQWTISLDAPSIREVRKRCDGLNLVDIDGKAYERMVDDPCLLVDTLWVLCEEQAKVDSITDVQFGRALVGDAIERATAAMLESIADFFPSAKKELLGAIAHKNAEIRDKGLSLALAKVNDPKVQEQAVAALEARMDAEVASLLTRLTNASASADS